MSHLTAFSLKNRALIALVTIVAAVFGFMGVGSLKQELMPSVQFPAIAVVTAYPGASPEVVNNDVSGPIETALRSVPQLENSSATSSTGMSMVVAQFTYGVDIAATEQKVERAISRISQLLPESADTQVMSGSIDDFPVIQVAVAPAKGESPEDTAQVLERTVIPALGDLDGVRDAQLAGAREQRISIDLDTVALNTNRLTSQSVVDALQQSGVLMAAGTITEDDRTLAVQAGTVLGSVEDVEELPIPVSAERIAEHQAELAAQQVQQPGVAQDPMQPDAGQGVMPGETPTDPAAPVESTEPQTTTGSGPPPLTIADVAEVTLEPGPEQSISRINGEPALTIAVTKMSAANTVEVSHAVQQELDEQRDQIGGATLTVVFDQAPYIEQSIHTLTTEGLLGLLFAVLVILVFLMSVRATLVTAISIPTSLLLTFVGLNFADYTLNMLTLGALTISIGRVVDDSIVVIENIKRHLTPDADRTKTIIAAVREVAGAITASTAATIAVFLPIAFVGDMVGEMFRPFAFTSAIALTASLFVSLTIVPVLAYWFLRPEGEGRWTWRRRAAAVEPGDDGSADSAATAGTAADRRGVAARGAAATADGPGADDRAEPLNAMQRGYLPIIDWTLKKPAITLLAAVLVFGLTIAASPFMKTNFMGADEQNSIGLVQTLEPGTSLDAQLEQVERVEEALEVVGSVETVQVTIGSSGGGMSAIFGGGGDGAVNYSLTTDSDADQVEVQDEIRAAVEKLDGAGSFSIGQSGGGVTMSSAIEINVNAPDQQTLEEASNAVEEALQQRDGLREVQSDLGVSRPFIEVAVDRTAAAAAGLSEAAVAGQVAQQMQPRQIGQVTMDADTLSVYLVDGEAAADQDELEDLQVMTALGARPLSALADIEVADGPVTIRTEDGARMVTVSAIPVGDDLGVAGAEVTEALDSVDLPTGASAEIGGVMSQQTEAFEQLGLALLAAILIVYVLMVATFRSLLQPLLLLISVPFAATGAILLLIATGIPLGVASLIGVLMLIGIVVTNAIVLIDLVNQYRERGDALREAVVHGSLQRLRPIVMTALATILALTPMGLGITGKGGFISQPLAVVVIGGLLSSTVLTLVVLPTLYYAVERRRERRRARRRSGGNALDDGAAALATAGAGAGAIAGAGAAGGGALVGAPVARPVAESVSSREPERGAEPRAVAAAEPVVEADFGLASKTEAESAVDSESVAGAKIAADAETDADAEPAADAEPPAEAPWRAPASPLFVEPAIADPDPADDAESVAEPVAETDVAPDAEPEMPAPVPAVRAFFRPAPARQAAPASERADDTSDDTSDEPDWEQLLWDVTRSLDEPQNDEPQTAARPDAAAAPDDAQRPATDDEEK